MCSFIFLNILPSVEESEIILLWHSSNSEAMHPLTSRLSGHFAHHSSFAHPVLSFFLCVHLACLPCPQHQHEEGRPCYSSCPSVSVFSIPPLLFLPGVAMLEAIVLQWMAETDYCDVPRKSVPMTCSLAPSLSRMMPEHPAVGQKGSHPQKKAELMVVRQEESVRNIPCHAESWTQLCLTHHFCLPRHNEPRHAESRYEFFLWCTQLGYSSQLPLQLDSTRVLTKCGWSTWNLFAGLAHNHIPWRLARFLPLSVG